jgi:hypothetical protein
LLVDLSSQKEIVQSKQTEIDNIKWAVSQLEKEKARLESHAEVCLVQKQIRSRDINYMVGSEGVLREPSSGY